MKHPLLALVLSSLILLGPISCTCGSEETGAAHPMAGSARAIQGDGKSNPLPRGVAQPGLPAKGEIEIVAAGETVTVLANQVSRIRLVTALSRSFGFELELLAFEDRAIDVRALGATLGDALAEALDGVPYAVRYGVVDGRSRLAWVAVGEEAERRVAERLRAERRPEEEERKRAEERENAKEEERQKEPRRPKRGQPRGPEEIARTARFLAGRAGREAEGRAEALQDLQSLDSETREAAAHMLDPEAPADVDRLAELAVHDEDYEVRVAAVEQLELSGSRDAVGAITEALRDPQPEVVVAAVKALRLLGDSSTVPLVEPLLEHENGEVRVQAETLVEVLQQAERGR